jgi:hypothetical protein
MAITHSLVLDYIAQRCGGVKGAGMDRSGRSDYQGPPFVRGSLDPC